MPSQEHVVLVDEENNVLGTAPKATVHHADTPLHRAFSLFLFNKKGQLLLQQRSHLKKTWPLVWSNSCCGHPTLDEPTEDAIRRRLAFELGIREAELYEVLPDFRYRAERDGIVENELCPVWVGFSDALPKPNPDEVERIAWVEWADFVLNGAEEFAPLSEWCIDEVQLLQANPLFHQLHSRPH